MNFKHAALNYRRFLQEHGRRSLAIVLSLLLITFTQSGLYAQAYTPLDAVQLNQVVAPIALYTDGLVAQILTASTYPQQINDADGWLHQYGGMPPDQFAAAVDSMPWDPSVKALTAFPAVLDNLTRNAGWTAALGNAYYNQPGDVMNAVQAMRMNAMQAGVLHSTVQQRVYVNNGLIIIDPVNPALVYVPYYNPWVVYGSPIVPWGGYYLLPYPRGVFITGVAIGFGVGIGIGLYAHYGWGYHAWSPNWHGGVVVYNHSTYISRSTTVYNHGNFGGYNRGVYEHAGAGVPGGFHPGVTHQSAAWGHGGPAGGGPAGGGHAGPSSYSHAGPAGGGHSAPAYGHAGPAGGGHSAPAYGHAGPAAGGHSSPSYGHAGPAAGGHSAPSSYAHAGPSGGVHSAPAAGGYHAPAGGMRPQSSPVNRSQNMSRPSAPAGNYHPQNNAGMRSAAPAAGHAPAPAGGGHAAPASHAAPSGGQHHR